MNTPRQPSFVVGIAGGSASGKSTFAAALRNELEGNGRGSLRVEQFSMDRYFRSIENGAPTIVSSDGEVRPDRNHPESADNAALVADVRRRSLADDAPDVIIIEGLMTLYVESVRALLDLRLFVDLDADLRALRRMLRTRGRLPDAPDTRERLASAMAYYCECARVGHALYVEPSRMYADLVLRGDSDLTRIAGLVGDIVCARLTRPERSLQPAVSQG